MHVRLGPEPRLVPVAVNQPESIYNSMFSYLVPLDDSGDMLMVRYCFNLENFSANTRKIIKHKMEKRECWWNPIQVFEVDLAGETIFPVQDIGRHRAVFVGEVACFSLDTRRFPCLAGNAVYLGAGVCFPPIGVRYLTDNTMDPAFQFATEDERIMMMEHRGLKGYRQYNPKLNLVPLARPCTLQEYLVCCAGLLGGLKD
jgi:hypothetical protein